MNPICVRLRSEFVFSVIGCFIFLLLSTKTIGSTAQLSVDEILALDADIDFGEYLAGECLTCHLEKNDGGSIPVIHGNSAEHLITAILEYRRKERSNETMQSVANNLNKEDIAALAAYFSVIR